MKQITSFILIALFAFACSGDSGKSEETKLVPDSFKKKAEQLINKEITIEGTVAHTCKHGGKRMFIIGTNPDFRVKVTAGDKISKFDASLEGSDVIVKGIVKEKRVDENYLNKWESDVKAEIPESENKIHSGEPGHEHHSDNHDLKKIAAYRKQLKESKKSHISFFSIECTSYEVKK